MLGAHRDRTSSPRIWRRGSWSSIRRIVFGQFSRFIKPGAKRIACTSNNDNLLAGGFINPDGKIAVVVYNARNSDQLMQLWVEGKAIRYTLPADAVITIIL